MSGRDTFNIAASSTGRVARASLAFAAGGGRTFLVRQTVPYPFHVTRAFHLDSVRPDVATLYLQSASGGLYRNDDLTLEITAKRGAYAQVTTQAATVVHDTDAQPARQRTVLDVEDDAFLAYTPDPLVLFAGASLSNETRIRLAPRARAIVVDAFTWHDPHGHGRPFSTLTQSVEVCDAEGRCLVHDRSILHGTDFLGDASPLGPFRTAASLLVLGPSESWPEAIQLRETCEKSGCLAGVTTLPNKAGLLLRCLAHDGGDLRRGLDSVVRIAFEAAAGFTPTVRRK